jgi:hypothetical protein
VPFSNYFVSLTGSSILLFCLFFFTGKEYLSHFSSKGDGSISACWKRTSKQGCWSLFKSPLCNFPVVWPHGYPLGLLDDLVTKWGRDRMDDLWDPFLKISNSKQRSSIYLPSKISNSKQRSSIYLPVVYFHPLALDISVFVPAKSLNVHNTPIHSRQWPLNLPALQGSMFLWCLIAACTFFQFLTLQCITSHVDLSFL